MSDWILIYTSHNLNSIEIVRSVLENEGIKAIIINKMDSMRLLHNSEIELYVTKSNVVNAKFVISKNKL